jgi:hypothetical protein
MVDPFNIVRKIFRNQPWQLAIQVSQPGSFTALDLSGYETKAVLCRLAKGVDAAYPVLGPIILSNDSPTLQTANTKAVFVFPASQTAGLQLGACSYRWLVEMSPSGSGSGASAVLCAGPAAVYDSPAWGSI